MPQKATALCFETAGSRASTNLFFKEFEIPDPGPNEVQIAFIFSPVTPTDILAITGNYSQGPLRKLPRALMENAYVAGYDGVARVTKVGQLAPKSAWEKDFRKDDIVIPLRMGIGTWCSHANIHETWLFNLSYDPFCHKSLPRSFSPIDIETFSYLRSVIFTGLFLLYMSFDLEHSHWIVMSEPVDPISWAMISLAKNRRVKVLVLLADKTEMKGPSRLDPRKRMLKDHGVDCVLLESEFERHREEFDNMRIVALFQNCSTPSVLPFIPFVRVGGSLVKYSFLCGCDNADPLSIVYYYREREIRLAGAPSTIPLSHVYNMHMDYTEHHFSTLDFDIDYTLRDLIVHSRIKTPTVKRIPWSARDKVLEAVSTVERQDTWRDVYVFDFEA